MGKSLRQIGSSLGISHEAVRKRLKGLEDREEVSTGTDQKLTAVEKEKVSTLSNAHRSMASKEMEHTVNQMSIKKTLSPNLRNVVNPSETPSERAREGKNKETDDLFGAIMEFLERKGIEVYRMNVEPEGYQVKRNSQIIRLYVQRNKEETG